MFGDFQKKYYNLVVINNNALNRRIKIYAKRLCYGQNS